MRRICTGLILALTVLAAGLVAAPSPASAAYPESSYYVSYGNSYVRGDVIWYNQSVGLRVTLHAASGCRYAQYRQYAGSALYGIYTVTACNGTESSSITLGGCPVAGGCGRVLVALYDQNQNYVGADDCRRSNAYCSNY
jgi:hypothetical protein